MHDIEQRRPEETEERTELGEVEKRTIQQEVRNFVQPRNKFEDDITRLLDLSLDSALPDLKQIGGQEGLEGGDPIEPLSAIKEITHPKLSGLKHPFATVHKAIVDVCMIKQGEKEGLLA